MQQQTLIAVYSSRAEAEEVRDRLLAMGVPQEMIRLSVETATAPRETTAESATTEGTRHSGFFDWLFGAEPSQTDRRWFETNLNEGRTALSVYLRDQSVDEVRVHAVLEDSGALDIESEDENAVVSGGTAASPVSAEAESARDTYVAGETAPLTAGAPTGATAERPAGSAAASTEGEQVIPLEKEELDIGKRKTERRRRIRTYVVEHPVEQEVHLIDETVVIERRPVEGVQSHSGEFQERDIELVERHEEPVVEKRTRADEEVVVSKRANEHVEQVRDKVRETKVAVDNDPGEPPETR